MQARKLIAEFLKNRREELNISQQELADKSGMRVTTMDRFESGRFWLDLKQYLIICHHLKCYPFLAEMEKDDEFAKLMRECWKRGDEDN